MQIELGTLEELDVKPGDKVQVHTLSNGDKASNDAPVWEIRNKYRAGCYSGVRDGWSEDHEGVYLSRFAVFKVVSRASDDPNTFTHSDGRTIDLTAITTPFGILSHPKYGDPETAAALKAHGGPYEIWTGSKWNRVSSAVWSGTVTYRVAPTPKVETVTQLRWFHLAPHGVAIIGGEYYASCGSRGKLTTTLQDGKPIRAVWEADQ